MTRPMRAWPIPVLSAALAVAVLATAPATSQANNHQEEIPFSVANLFFELNDTDGDLGIHSLIDGEPWKELSIEDPTERKLLDIRVKGNLRRQGLTELFFESAEPSFDELLPEDFFARFPPGEYEIEGLSNEGEALESTAVLSHVLPAPPEEVMVSGVAAAEDCDADPLPVVGEPVVISWEPVTDSHPELGEFSDALEVVKYQVVVEREEPERLILSVDLPPDVNSFEVPEDFTALDSGDGFKFEILVREASGNQTAIESCFELE